MIDDVKLIACGVIIIALTIVSAGTGLKAYQQGITIDTLNKTISQQAASIETKVNENAGLKASIGLQNAEIDNLQLEAAAAHQVVDKAISDSLPLIEAEGRRISGIRSAPKSSSYDDIRAKMLQDATL